MKALKLNWVSGLARVGTLIHWLLLVLLPLPLPVLRPDDQYILRYYAAIKRVMEPVLLHVFLLLRPANNLTTRDLLFNLPGYSNTKYKEFTQPQRQMLDNNVPSEVYDVSLLYKLLLKLCGLHESNCSVAGTLENKLKKLKDHRNDLSHEDIQLTSNDLQCRVTEIKNVCREVLEEAGSRSGQLVSHLVAYYVREMENGLTEVLTGGVDLWEPYRQGLQHLRQEQCNVLIREGKEDMRLLAQKRRILNPFAWLLDSNFSHLDVTEVFTELTLEAENALNMQDMLTVTLPSGQLPDAIIVSGSPGSGKTSLTRFLLHDSLSMSPAVHGLSNFDMVLPIETRFVSSTDVCSLVRDELLPRGCQQLHRDDVLATLRDVSVFWIIDGYDEATVSTKQLIKELLQKCSSSKIMITTRTDCEREVEMLLSDLHLSHLTLSNKGFTEGNIKVCTEKLFCVSVQNPQERKDSFDEFNSYLDKQDYYAKSIFEVPLFLSMLALLWLDNPKLVSSATTTTRLFDILINNIVNKMILREPLRQLNLAERKLRNKIKKFLNELGKLFWDCPYAFTLTESDYLTEKLEKCCDDLDLPFDEVMSPFFVKTEKATPVGTKKEYTIIHRTVQDFLRAKTFCDIMLDCNCDILTTASDLKENSREYIRSICSQHDDFMERYFSVVNFTMKKLCDDDERNFENNSFTRDDYHSFWYDILADFENEDARRYCHHFFKSCRHDSTLSFMSGYLKVKNALTRARAEQIVYVTSILDIYLSFWLQLIKESEEDRILIEEISSHLSLFQWKVSSYEVEETREMVKYVTPQLVYIHQWTRCESDAKGILQIVNTFSQLPVDVGLNFQRDSFEAENVHVRGQESLDIVLGESSQCSLTTFIWPDNTPCLNLLKKASNLQELWIQVSSVEDLNKLAELTNSLQHLQHLTVTVDSALSTTDPRIFPSLINQKWREKTVTQKMGPLRSLPPRPSMPPYLSMFSSSTDVDTRVPSLPHHLPTRSCGSSYVHDVARKLRLPMVTECRAGCTRLGSGGSAGVHISAIKYHKECIKRIGFIQNTMELAVRSMTVSDKTSWKLIDPCAKYHDTEGTWWSRVCIGVCAALTFQHRTSLQMHRRFLKCFYPSKLSTPIHLRFTVAQNLDPKWLGAAVAQLCPYPACIFLKVNMDVNWTCEHLYSLMFWLYTSAAQVTLIDVRLMYPPELSKDGLQRDILEYSKFTDMMNKMAPGVSYEVLHDHTSRE